VYSISFIRAYKFCFFILEDTNRIQNISGGFVNGDVDAKSVTEKKQQGGCGEVGAAKRQGKTVTVTDSYQYSASTQSWLRDAGFLKHVVVGSINFYLL
jgi:hypothetical protein